MELAGVKIKQEQKAQIKSEVFTLVEDVEVKALLTEEVDIKEELLDAWRPTVNYTNVKSTEMKLEAYECYDCKFKTHCRQYLKKHIAIHQKPFKCNDCIYRAASKAELKHHRSSFVHKKLFECFDCGYQSRFKAILQKHIMSHLRQKYIHKKPKKYLLKKQESKPYRCNKCNFKTSTRDRWRLHYMNIHLRIKVHACDKCKYKSNYKRDFQEHLRNHSGEKPFRCAECHFKTALKRNLQRHVKIHSDVKPFECYQCGYKARRKYHLQGHMNSHLKQVKKDAI